MAHPNETPLVLVAGVRNEDSLGWAAARAWLERANQNRLLMTVRSDKAVGFAEEVQKEYGQRVEAVQVDWTDDGHEGDEENEARPGVVQVVRQKLEDILGSERLLSGAVHAVANAPAENFTLPAHEVSPEVYLQTYDVTTVSFLRVIQSGIDHIRPRGGFVTLGYEQYGRVSESYGGALSTAKVALSHLTRVQGVSLGPNELGRTLEIVPGFVDTYAARGFSLGASRKAGVRLKPTEAKEVIGNVFSSSSPLRYTSPDQQREATGQLAIDFIEGGPYWDHITGETMHPNGGRTTRNTDIFEGQSAGE